jgi:hypothetical protein
MLLPDPVTLVGFKIVVSPDEEIVLRLTTPLKPLTGPIEIVSVVWVPAFTVNVLDEGVMVKS